MKLGRSTSGAIKIKTDVENSGLRAVSCGCCNPGPCGGCPTILGALPATGTPPVMPTSIAWQAIFAGGEIGACDTFLSGTISGDECSITAYHCKSVDTPEFFQALLFVSATLQIGKFKKKTSSLGNACGEFNYDFLETDPESECALWFSIGIDSVYDSYLNEGSCGAVQPQAAGTGNFFGPIPLTSIIGTHSVSGTFVISRPAVGIGEEGEAIPFCSCASYSAQVTASITIS
jgi:hypothetical protein